ncbi:hypothetical protein VE00_02711 [Pseudogymnoascus sp. WSF 3629]|nr:hypothetical protein VE00_02711 [Pseudogymnoascus sp. WSF 3629]
MESYSVPNEIIVQICSYLCSHCQNPGVFPNSNTVETRIEKVTLARMCRSSKRICSIAQPILFHYYACGNLARSVHTEFSEHYADWNRERWNLEDDKLAVFVRTLITRPDLASCVESLQLKGSGKQDVCTPELMKILGDAGSALGFKLPTGWSWGGWTGKYPDVWTDEVKPESFNENRLDFHKWLMAVAIALTPRTETLMYMCEYIYELDWSTNTPPMVLPALKTLALRGAQGGDYYLFQIHPFLTAAPNLQTLYALNCRGDAISSIILLSFDYNDGDPWVEDLAVSKLRKLVLDELPMEAFEKLMERCVELEDLVYYIHFWHDCPDITRAFSQTEKRLKKLCFGYLPDPVPTGYESLLDDEDYGTIPIVTSLREFTQLEELVIDQALLYRKSDSSRDTERLEGLLPPSIRRVHFTYVYKSMYEDLIYLASVAPGSFPKLQSVKIGLVSPIPPERVEEIEHMKTVEPAFADVGVHVSWEENVMGPFLYTAIPGGAPGLTVTSVPSAPLPFP